MKSSGLLGILLLLARLPSAYTATPLRMDVNKKKGETVQGDEATNYPTIRLYLVRHGETLANIQKVVVGQFDSSLTKLGQQQASTLGNSDIIRGTEFWRRYASDLRRTQHTAELIDSNKSFILDERLREIAKGARQGFPKSYTMDQCMECFKNRPEEIPKQESSQEAWERLSSFLHQLLDEAALEEGTSRNGQVVRNARNVLVVSHSGTIRLLLHKLVPDADPLLQVSADTTGALEDSKRFQIPNTSLTILDISRTLNRTRHDTESQCAEQRITASLRTLNSIDHLTTI